MSQHQSILEYKNGRYLKLAIGLCALAIGAYLWYEPTTVYVKPNGGTWLGYTLGTIGAVLILWLMLLGVRKRRYRSRAGSLQGWTSAHVYIGTSLLVIVTLHCAFEFGWNVHTAAYVLMVLVIVSGFFGVYAYLRYPALMTANLHDAQVETIVLKIADLDRKCRRMALDLPDEVNEIVMKSSRASLREPRVRTSFRRRLAGDTVHCPTRDACAALTRIGAKFTGESASLNQQLLTAMTQKSVMIDQLRRDRRYRAILEIWLVAHVPLSFALLATLIAHVVSVFYFW
jgi:hypothetical protein